MMICHRYVSHLNVFAAHCFIFRTCCGTGLCQLLNLFNAFSFSPLCPLNYLPSVKKMNKNGFSKYRR